MTGPTREALSALVLIAALCGIAVVLLVVLGFIAAVVRVGVMGRVLVVPFRGGDERRVEITALFARRLMEIEERWTSSAHEIDDLQRDVEAKSRPFAELRDVASASSGEMPSISPLADRAAMPLRPSSGGRDQAGFAAGTGPRDTGGDFSVKFLF